MKVLVFSSLYPNAQQPSHGIFVENRLRQLLAFAPEIEARVIAPVPWFPSRNARFGDYAKYAAVDAREIRHGIAIRHPRYPVIPKIGMQITPWLMYRAAPFVARTYPTLRAHQFIGLARLAFRTGHAYWGWRFAGMAMHYVQDLTQPYHASILPGVSTLRMIAANTVAMIGWKGPKDSMVVLASNRHLAFERYEALLIYRDTAAGGKAPMIAALQDSSRDKTYPAWSDLYLRDVVTQESFDFGETLSAALLSAFPPKYVSDPSYDFGASGGSGALIAEVAERTPQQRAAIEGAVVELMGHFGAHSRNMARAVGATRPPNQ